MSKTSINPPLAITAIVVGLIMLIWDWFYGTKTIGLGWTIVVFIVGLIMLGIGLLRLILE
jgi:membrane-bound ClpP family serine protease